MNLPKRDPDGTHWIAALLKSLDEFGWTEGRNFRLDIRWGVGAAHVQKNAEELVALNPDLIVAASPPAVLALQQASRKVPIIFVAVTDPVALGMVESLARPGGNATGFSPAEVDLSAKWVQVLKEMVPTLTRIAVFQNPVNLGGVPQFAAVQTAAASLGVALSIIDVRDKSAIEQAVATFANQPNGGLVTLRISENVALRDSLIALAASIGCRLPTPCGCSPPAAAWRPTVPTLPRSTGRPPAMLIASLEVKTRQFAGPDGEQVPAGHQSQDRQIARPGHPANAPCHRRRSP